MAFRIQYTFRKSKSIVTVQYIKPIVNTVYATVVNYADTGTVGKKTVPMFGSFEKIDLSKIK